MYSLGIVYCRLAFQVSGYSVPAQDVGFGLGLADDVGLMAGDQHRGRPGHSVEVAAGDFLVGAGVQDGKDIPYLDLGDRDGGHEPVAVTTLADDVGLIDQRRIGFIGDAVVVEMVFVPAAGEPKLGGIDGDDIPTDGRGQAFDIANGGQMDASVAEDGTAGLELEHQAPGLDALFGQLLAQGPGGNFGICLDGWGFLVIRLGGNGVDQPGHDLITGPGADQVESLGNAMEGS